MCALSPSLSLVAGQSKTKMFKSQEEWPFHSKLFYIMMILWFYYFLPLGRSCLPIVQSMGEPCGLSKGRNGHGYITLSTYTLLFTTNITNINSNPYRVATKTETRDINRGLTHRPTEHQRHRYSMWVASFHLFNGPKCAKAQIYKTHKTMREVAGLRKNVHSRLRPTSSSSWMVI